MLKNKAFAVLAGTILIAASPVSHAADWAPSEPITLQVGFAAGGSTDTLARVVASAIEESKGWNIVVENKPGGGGIAMFSALTRTKPDGLKIGMGVTAPIVMNLAIRPDKLPFKADGFDYLATVAKAELGFVAKKDAPYNTFAEFVDWAKAKGKARVGFDAKPQELVTRAVSNTFDVKLNLVSYNGGLEITQNLMGGHLDAGFGGGQHIKFIQSGDLKLLGAVSKERHGYAPDIPTFAEQGFPVLCRRLFLYRRAEGPSRQCPHPPFLAPSTRLLNRRRSPRSSAACFLTARISAAITWPRQCWNMSNRPRH